ncbi:MAG: 2-oxo acid dehydrogenase subunit E2 [Moraxella sp.]
MKVTAYALMQHPKFNSHLSDDNTQIIIRKSVNLGFAVATEEGLTVPVIQRVEQKASSNWRLKSVSLPKSVIKTICQRVNRRVIYDFKSRQSWRYLLYAAG